MADISLQDQLDYLNREIRRYRQLAAHVVAQGAITEAEAAHELVMLEAIAETLTALWAEEAPRPVRLTMVRYGIEHTVTKASVQEAAADACADIETNAAAPARLEVDGVCVWANTGPFSGCYDALRALAGLPEEKEDAS